MEKPKKIFKAGTKPDYLVVKKGIKNNYLNNQNANQNVGISLFSNNYSTNLLG